MINIPPAVVAFAGSRDSYQVPLALQEAGLLDCLVSDFYWPPNSGPLDRIPGFAPWSRALRCRSADGLPRQRVRVSPQALAAGAVARWTRSPAWNRRKDVAIGEVARCMALKSGSSLISYSYYASTAFREQGDRPEHRILFQVHPNPTVVRRILQEEVERRPEARDSLRAEYELSLPDPQFEALCQEPVLANGWIVASGFSASSLAEAGIPRDQVHVVPYGVDASRYPQRLRAPDGSGPFRVIFVGSMVQRKGLSDLLDAVRSLGRGVRLTLCGRGMIDRRLIANYSDLDIDVKVALSRDEVVRELHQSHVFALPSIAEGFALVILEAMSCGLPVITTANTCAPDVIDHGQDGWILPIRAPERLAETLAWGREHPSELAEMGVAAAAKARSFHWERFREGIRSAYRQIASARPGATEEGHGG